MPRMKIVLELVSLFPDLLIIGSGAISVLGDLKKDFDSAHSLLRGQKYKTVISWYDNNAKIIDMRKLRAFKEKYSEGYGQHFTFSDEEMDAYEQELRKELEEVMIVL